MDINQLNCFISVARTLNFSEAARRNYVSQSTVSRYIGDLEKELGVKLFTRSNRDVIITPEGKEFLTCALDMVSSLEKAKSVLANIRDGGHGRLRIACDHTSIRFTSRCLREFGRRYPNISIELCRPDSDDLGRAIAMEEYDFCFLPRDMVPERSDIETVSTHSEKLAAVTGKRFRTEGAFSLPELADTKLLLLSESCAPILYMEVMDLLRTFHISPAIESGFEDLSLLACAVSSDMGVALLPQTLAETISPRLVNVFELEDADTDIAYVCARAKNAANPVAKLFAKIIRQFADGEDNVLGI